MKMAESKRGRYIAEKKINTALLRLWLAGKGLTPTELAEMAGLHRNTIRRILAGKPARMPTIHKIMKATGLTYEELVNDD